MLGSELLCQALHRVEAFRQGKARNGIEVCRLADRPGLLARIGRIFFDYGIELQAAKIATLGERVEDVFFITDTSQRPLEDEALCSEIQAAICKELDEQAAA